MNFVYFTQIQRDVHNVYKNLQCSISIKINGVYYFFQITMIYLAAATSSKHAAQRNITAVIAAPLS